MAIRQHKYAGKALMKNCRVEVDYEAHRVYFKSAQSTPLKEIRKNFLIEIGMSYFMMSVIPVIMYAFVFDIGTSQYNAIGALMLFTIPPAMGVYIYNKRLDDKTWVKEKFPQTNAFLCPRTWEEKKIEKDAIISNMYVIPEFANISIEYRAIGDFKKQLKRISIVNRYVGDPYTFQAAFIFKKKPKDGSLWVKYI